MTFQDYFPIWNKLQTDQQDRIRSNLNFRTVKKGTILHNGDMDCTGLLLVKAGQLRAYILSDEGREITIYRLFDRDLCLFSASCIMRSIQFEVTIQAEKKIVLDVGGGSLTLDGQGKKATLKMDTVSVEAGQSLTLKGQSVKVEGSMMTVSSSGNLEAKASGVLTLKGSMTKIN